MYDWLRDSNSISGRIGYPPRFKMVDTVDYAYIGGENVLTTTKNIQ